MFTQPYSEFILKCSPNFPFLLEESYNKIFRLKTDAEVCGVIRDGKLIELINHTKNFEAAIIDTADIKDGDILFHTHTSDKSAPRFSKRDMLTAKRNKLPMLLFHTHFKVFDFWTPHIPHPYPLKLTKWNLELDDYLRLPYQWVRSDCYTFCKDVACGIYKKQLPEIYNRQQSPSTIKYFFRNPEQLGFHRISRFKEGCFVLMQMSVNIPYHMGIITHVRENDVVIMHQLNDEVDSSYLNLRDYQNNVIGVYDIQKDNQISFTPVKT